MSSWNGGITRRQLGWLQQELAAAEAAGERVLVASHHQLGQGGARATHMAWNWREVQEVGGVRPAGVACWAALLVADRRTRPVGRVLAGPRAAGRAATRTRRAPPAIKACPAPFIPLIALFFVPVPQALLASPAFCAAFAGHDHTGGYACIDGRHFITVEGLLEAPSGGNAYAVVDVHADRLVIHGRGSVTSRQLPL